MFDLVVFDWDGTLIDSTGRIADCLAYAARETGLPLLPRERYIGIIGLGLPEAFRALYPEAGDALRTELRSHYARHYIALGETEPSRPYEGAVELLDGLRARGLKLAVATGKNRPGLERAFAQTGLRDRFHASRTSDETASKPDPRMLNELLAEFGVAPSRALMVGDTGFDLEMAARAGVPSLGLTHGAHDAAELLRHGPRALLDRLGDVLAFIEQNSAESVSFPVPGVVA
ncbi:MAG: HAD family hydrolase [Pseudomonadota bacterium]